MGVRGLFSRFAVPAALSHFLQFPLPVGGKSLIFR